MRIHEREQPLNILQSEIELKVWDMLDKAEVKLTPWEVVRVVSGALSAVLGQTAKYEIRMERHGNYEKEGGLA